MTTVTNKAIVHLGLILLLAPVSAGAKTLYVNGSTGSDSTSYAANGPSAPWRTIGRAAWGSTNAAAPNPAEAASAGDTVIIAPGTYSVAGTNERHNPAYNPANSGTAGNLITFQATGTVNLTLSSGQGPLIGSYLRNYVRWLGPFSIDTANAPSKADTAPVAFAASTGSSIDGTFIDGDDYTFTDGVTARITIVNSSVGNPSVIRTATAHGLSTGSEILIENHSGSTPNLNAALIGLGVYRVTVLSSTTFSIAYQGGTNVNVTVGGTGGTIKNLRQDNYSGVRCEDSSDITIRNTTIHNFYGPVNVRNAVGIMIYRCGGVTIEHNEIYNSGSGIYLKGGFATQTAHSAVWSTGYTIRYNLIYNIGRTTWPSNAGGVGIVLGSGAPGTAVAPVRVYQNIIRGAPGAAIEFLPLNNTNRWNEPHFSYVVNNTIVGGSAGDRFGISLNTDLMANSSNRAWNNIIHSMGQNINWSSQPSAAFESRFDPEHNVYYNADTQFGAAGFTNYATFASWLAAYANFDHADPDSITSDPLFANVAALNFRLQAGSPALTLGVDVLDLDGDGNTTDLVPAGAYITGTEVIGRMATGGTPPLPPSNLRITQQ